MQAQTPCLGTEQLVQLLSGSLPANQEKEMADHLETCSHCQQTAEKLAGAGSTWSKAACLLRGDESEADAGSLQRVIAVLKREGGWQQPTQAESEGEEPISLDFLAPPSTPGGLGRLDHYEVVEVIGRGGMGIVLEAFDEVLQRVVALKVLAPHLAVSKLARKRFLREAQAAAAVSHDNVVAIHAVADNASVPYLVMQYVAGVSLQERLDRQGALELREVLRIGMQTAAGLAAAHAQGLVHRDIKPSNILLENGVARVKITDFGLARIADDMRLTQTGLVVGTPQYMAPEQARGDAVDQRADLFSLGSVLYAMSVGRPPFQAENSLAVLKRVCEEAPRPVCDINPSLPRWLDDILSRLHAKEPAERFPSAAEVADLLAQHLARLQQPSAAPVPGAVKHVPVTKPRRRLEWAAAVLVLAAGAFVVAEGTGTTRVVDTLATVLRIRTPEGTLVVEVDDPRVKVSIDGSGQELTITGAGLQEVRLRPGRYKVHASRDGQAVAVSEELVTISRGEKRVVKVSREVEAVLEEGKGAPVVIPIPARPRKIKAYGPEDKPIGRDGLSAEDKGWRVEASKGRTVRLFEHAAPNIDSCMVIYRARMKTADVQGKAYLEMWCRFPGLGEYFSRGLVDPARGTTDWSSYETPFRLEKGQRPDLIRLNLVIEGKGTVWIKDIELLQAPLPAE